MNGIMQTLLFSPTYAVAPAGTLFGVGPDQYETVEGAADAIRDCEVLGLETEAVAKAVAHCSKEHRFSWLDFLGRYEDVLSMENPNGAWELKRTFSEVFRYWEESAWKAILAYLRDPAHQLEWAFEGGLMATVRPIPYDGPIHVYSNPALIPPEADPRSVSVVVISPLYFHPNVSRRGEVDIREIRPIHSLNEGIASRLVELKMVLMELKLDKWKKCHPENWQNYRKEILTDLTAGDKQSKADPIKVGRFEEEGEFLLLNGHRRIATLALLAAQDKIPSAWLTRIPVDFHPVRERRYVVRITGGVHLRIEAVLQEVDVEERHPSEIFRALEAVPVRPSNFEPWALPYFFVEESGLRFLQKEGGFTQEEVDRHIVRLIAEGVIKSRFLPFRDLWNRLGNNSDLHRLIFEEVGEGSDAMIHFVEAMYPADPERIGPLAARHLERLLNTPKELGHIEFYGGNGFLESPDLQPVIEKLIESEDLLIWDRLIKVWSDFFPVPLRIRALEIGIKRYSNDSRLVASLSARAMLILAAIREGSLPMDALSAEQRRLFLSVVSENFDFQFRV